MEMDDPSEKRSTITSLSGSSKVFTMGLVTYSNQGKTSILKVPKQVIKKNGAVSIQCCFTMVNNLSKISKRKQIGRAGRHIFQVDIVAGDGKCGQRMGQKGITNISV